MQQDRVLISGGLLFDGCNPPVPDHAVLIEGARISRVAPAGEFEGYAGRRIDSAGQTLMPGLIDCHVHLTFGSEPDMAGIVQRLSLPELALKTLENARDTLAGGVTSARDCGGRDFVEIIVRDVIRAGRQPGPTLRCAGRLICMTGGHGRWVGREADGVEEVQKAVRETIRGGADCIKIMATGGVTTPNVDPLVAHFLPEEIAAGIAEAHRLGLKAASHAQGAGGIANALAAGVDSIEHGFELDEAVIERMVAAGTFLVPTLSATACLLATPDERVPDYVIEKATRYNAMHEDSVRRFVAAGGRVAMGTDAGTPFNRHGENGQELKHLVRIGMTPLAALRAATSEAAELLDLPGRGVIEDGAFADLLLVDGDPASDIGCAADRSHHRLVIKGGAPFRKEPASRQDAQIVAGRVSEARAAARAITLPSMPAACCWGEPAEPALAGTH